MTPDEIVLYNYSSYCATIATIPRVRNNHSSIKQMYWACARLPFYGFEMLYRWWHYCAVLSMGFCRQLERSGCFLLLTLGALYVLLCTMMASKRSLAVAEILSFKLCACTTDSRNVWQKFTRATVAGILVRGFITCCFSGTSSPRL